MKTLPKLLDLLRIQGCIVTADAMSCQKQTIAKIAEKKADYVICLKANHSYLYEHVKLIFDRISSGGYSRVNRHRYETQDEKAHGRKEIRKYCALSKNEARKVHHLDIGDEWTKLKSITQVISIRKQGEEEPSTAIRYYLSSLQPNAPKIAEAIRSHWEVENQLNWSLDVSFREDESRIRKENSPVNFALVRRLALNLLRADPLPKSLRRKRKRCGWSPQYLMKVLTNQQFASV